MQMAAQGFRAVKVKVGLGVDADIARVKAVRSALGENFSVAVDANGGWTESEALAALPHLEACRINAIEQPLHRRDFRGCARLRARTSIPIMLDDAIFTPEDALEAIRCEACDLIRSNVASRGFHPQPLTLGRPRHHWASLLRTPARHTTDPHRKWMRHTSRRKRPGC